MNTRIVMFLAAALTALPLVLAGCGNKGPLVMPDAVPVEPAEAVSDPLPTDTPTDTPPVDVGSPVDDMPVDPLPIDPATVPDSAADTEPADTEPTSTEPAETAPTDVNDDGNG